MDDHIITHRSTPSGGSNTPSEGSNGSVHTTSHTPPSTSADGTTFFVVDSLLKAESPATGQLKALTKFAVRMVGAAMLQKGVSPQAVDHHAVNVFDRLVADGKIKVVVVDAHTQIETKPWSCLFQTLCNLKRIGNLVGDDSSRKHLLDTLSAAEHGSRLAFSTLKEGGDGLPLINVSQGDGDLTVEADTGRVANACISVGGAVPTSAAAAASPGAAAFAAAAVAATPCRRRGR